MFHKPMLASQMPERFNLTPGTYAAEEKFDGHRLIVEVNDVARVAAWSRNGLPRRLPMHLEDPLSALPPGTYDGELIVPGKRSYGVKDVLNERELVYVVFDALELVGAPTTEMAYRDRRIALSEIFRRRATESVFLSPSTEVNTQPQVQALLEAIWKRDGEGLILKRLGSRYAIGKRNKDWIKMKGLRSKAMVIIGFCASQGEIQNRGPYATTVVKDEEENITIVKTLNDDELKNLQDAVGPEGERAYRQITFLGRKVTMDVSHPYVGRLLRIEYQERTPDGGYRHPRWDRYEEQ